MTELLLRCSGPLAGLRSIANVYGVPAARAGRALPAAAAAVSDECADRDGALLVALARELGVEPARPIRIVYYHATRALDPGRIRRCGLLTLSERLDGIWSDIGVLVPEIDEQQLAKLRADMTAGRAGLHTYAHRLGRLAQEDGPFGLVVRELFLRASEPATNFLRTPEIVEDICLAIVDRFAVDAVGRYSRAAVPCIVEFARPPSDVSAALASAAWYVEAALRGAAPGPDAAWSYSGDGVAVPPEALLSVRAADGSEIEW